MSLPHCPLLEAAANCGVDAFIVADFGVLAYCKKYAENVPVHISTQAGIVNYAAARQFYELGAQRIVTARELSLTDIAEIRAKTPKELEIECFVHGAMCVSFSGRCLLSNYLLGRDANRGACAQPCRWEYALMEKKRDGLYFPIEEDKNGTYILNSKDMCMIEHIPELVAAGIDSFKIEGRAKSAYYTAVITNAYRAAIDGYLQSPSPDYTPEPWIVEETKKSAIANTVQDFISATRRTMPISAMQAAMSARGMSQVWSKVPTASISPSANATNSVSATPWNCSNGAKRPCSLP